MNVVAHEDDDLLFMSPDLIHDIKAGHCVRTVYVTAGDAGSGQFYWLSREQGSEAAYAKMIGDEHALWVQRVVKLDDKAFMTIANPRNNPRISLVFLRLPDGNIGGQGFNSSHHESLERLLNGQLQHIQSVTKQSVYSAPQLTNALVMLMQTYQPAEIRTQSEVNGHAYPDHSDHMAVGRLTQQAYNRYEQIQYENKVVIPFKTYLGYPGHELPQNVFGADLEAKTAAFLAYAAFDGGVCQNVAQCSHTSTYDAYLKRQYERGK
jgi:LmbE family N-acetylglucosaminyl deacetylase